MNKSVAVAVFVKTPGLSPIKTRLAAGLGEKRAAHFYSLSLDSVRSVLAELPNLSPSNSHSFVPYWAIAEEEGMESEYWDGFGKVFQGSGTLGRRLATVYNELLAKHSAVIFLGSDSPQIRSELLVTSAKVLLDSDTPPTRFVVGPSLDGGFYLLGGSTPVPEVHWTSVQYSTASTLSELVQSFSVLGGFTRLTQLSDVDTVEDLLPVCGEMAQTGQSLTKEQLRIFSWLGEECGLK